MQNDMHESTFRWIPLCIYRAFDKLVCKTYRQSILYNTEVQQVGGMVFFKFQRVVEGA